MRLIAFPLGLPGLNVNDPHPYCEIVCHSNSQSRLAIRKGKQLHNRDMIYDIPHYLRQKILKETPSIMEKTIITTELEKPIWLKKNVKSNILKTEINVGTRNCVNECRIFPFN